MDRYGVIFDMDGVLIDTYRSHFESWRRMAAEHDYAMTEEQFGATFGRTSREIIALLWGDQGLTEEQIRHADQEKERIFREIIDRDFPLMDGAEKLLISLKDNDFGIAIGSSGPPENVALTVAHLREIVSFDATVHSGDVKHGKPAPDVFLTAAERMRIEPTRCVVIEDAVPGLEAAHAAGMKSIGMVSTGHTREELARADRLVETLAEITPATIRAMLAPA